MLLIDIGNSRVKVGTLAAGTVIPCPPRGWRGEDLEALWCAMLGPLVPSDRVLVSNVGGPEIADALSGWLRREWSVAVEFARVQQDFAGLHTRYELPGKLGVDRWLAALAGFHLSQGAVCVVDAGTALTADVVTAQGEHLGGLIAPGLGLMARSLTQGTAQLVIDTVQPVARIATNTASAISLGCCEAVAGLLQQFAARLERELDDTPIWWLTGGEAPTVLALSTLPLQLAPELVLAGLARYGEAAP